jgi:formylglycine-generating enzyme required for sulfatase activity
LLVLAACAAIVLTDAFAQSQRQPFQECPECPEMISLPAGEFLAGSPLDELGRHSDESTPHRVQIEQAFAIGRYEVTAQQWDACVTAGACRRARDWGQGHGTKPALDVSWDDAQSYVAWLNSRVEGARYRLPTEDEWEYAARAGSNTRYHWGDNEPACDAGALNGANSKVCRPMQLAPVGSYAPNGFGLFDTSGNAWEWTADCYVAGAAQCGWRVVRGGSWGNPVEDLRSANRSLNAPSYRSNVIGFRVARDMP